MSSPTKTARRLDLSTWVVDVQASQQTYLVSSQFFSPRMVISVGRVRRQSKKEKLKPGLMIIEEEIWSGSVDTIRPARTLQDFVGDFLKCHMIDTPIELAYDWGGLVNHREIKTTNLHRDLQ